MITRWARPARIAVRRVRAARPRRHAATARVRATARPVPGRPADEGRVLLLSLVFGLLALTLVMTVVSATAVHLDRKRVLALADQAALAGAMALDEGAYYARDGVDPGAEGLVVLTDASVRQAVEAHLEGASEAARFPDLAVVTARTPDGRTAVVTLSATAHPPLLSWVTQRWSGGIPLELTSRARAG